MSTLFSAVILAAGRSSRMGQDKAQLELNGQTLLHHTQHLVHQLGCDDVHISHPRLGVADDRPDFGPLSGLHTLLPRCQHSRVLVLPIDMPLMTKELLDTLLQHSHTESVYFSPSALPCVLHNSTAMHAYIEQQLTPNGRRSVNALLAWCQARALPISQQPALTNTNTPSEWQQALQYWQRNQEQNTQEQHKQGSMTLPYSGEETL